MIDFEVIDEMNYKDIKSMIDYIEPLAYIERPKYGDFIQVLFDKKYGDFIVNKDSYFYRILNHKISFLDTVSFFFDIKSERIILSNHIYEKKKIWVPLNEILSWNWKKVRKNFEIVKFQFLQI
jgi:hypothetical protein